MSKKISTLSPGNLVKLNEHGVARPYIFLQYNHYSKNEVVLIKKERFEAERAHSPSSGYNDATSAYFGSDADSFCNAEHIQCLDPIVRACLVNVPIPISHSEGDYTGMRKCFLLSATEVGLSPITDVSFSQEGQSFAYFGSNENRVVYLENVIYPYSSPYKRSGAWWLRTPYSDMSVVYVNTSGRLEKSESSYTFHSRNGYRPALALSSEILVSDSPDAEGCYTVVSAPAGEQYQKVNGAWLRMC